jgi:hypothetical protein
MAFWRVCVPGGKGGGGQHTWQASPEWHALPAENARLCLGSAQIRAKKKVSASGEGEALSSSGRIELVFFFNKTSVSWWVGFSFFCNFFSFLFKRFFFLNVCVLV